MRIFDRIASGESVRYGPGAHPDQARFDAMHRKFIHEAVRVIADESFEYIRERGWTDRDIKEFGVLIPPFDKMWIEWQLDSHNDMAISLVRNVQEGQDHAIVAMLFGHDRVRGIARFPVSMNVLTRLESSGTATTAYGGMVKTEYENRFNHLFAPAWLALAWMNCQNLELRQSGPSPTEMRRRRKRGQPIGLDYRRIVLADRYAHRWEKTTGESAKRFHSVRGHLATYTAEKPMFGKYVGTFWKPAHVRGDAKLGRINHEYHVTNRGAQ